MLKVSRKNYMCKSVLAVVATILSYYKI